MGELPRKYSPEDTASRIRRWCDKAERAHRDVAQKLVSWGVPRPEREELIAALIAENLLNEERYAEAFAHDHFHFRQWGVLKITAALKAKGVSDANIRRALRRIPAEEEKQVMKDLLGKLERSLVGKRNEEKIVRAARRLVAKGFAPEAAWSAARSHFSE